jgi:hypothetical protein
MALIAQIMAVSWAERVFSMLETLFGSKKRCSLADFIRGSMMLHYSNTKYAGKGTRSTTKRNICEIDAPAQRYFELNFCEILACVVKFTPKKTEK